MMNNLRDDSAVDLVMFWENEVKPRLGAGEVYAGVDLLRHEGRYWRGRCPLHGGQDANFSVDTKTLRWTCFSHCGNGSVLAFLNGGEEPNGRQWVDAVRALSQRVGVAFPKRDITPAEEQRWAQKERRCALLEMFWHIAQKALRSPQGRAARAYLIQNRGFSENEIDHGINTVGFYSDSITRQLREAGFSDEEIQASGVTYDQRWEGRLLLSWRDHRGEIGTFAARSLDSDATPPNKYLYLTTQHGWARGKNDLLAFGLDTALPAARRMGSLVLVEGLFDAILLQAYGFKHVAAIGGGGGEMSLVRLQGLAGLGIGHITLLLDNDHKDDGSWPGLEGTVAVLQNVRKDVNVPIVDVVHPSLLAMHKDPDALVRQEGIQALEKLLEQREPGAIFQARLLLEGVTPRSDDATRRRAVDRVLELNRTLEGARAVLDREDTMRLTSAFTGYSIEALSQLEEEFQRHRRREILEQQIDQTLREAQNQRSKQAPAPEVLGKLQSEIASLRALTVEQPAEFSVERLERESAQVARGKTSGWQSLDALDVRFNAGELAIMGARTGHGKTSVLVSLLLNWLQPLANGTTDETLVLYSAEEPEVRIYHRLLSLLTASEAAGWTVAQIRDFLRDPYSRGSDYSWPDPRSLERSREFLRGRQNNLLVVYRPAWSIDDIEAHARNLCKQRPIGALLVDYLQRVPPPSGRFDRRDQEVSAIGRRLKGLAVDLATPVIAGAQINREAIPEGYSKRMNDTSYIKAKEIIRGARPELHHLREGGSEQEADLILGLLNYAADYRGGESLSAGSLLEVGTLKNRYGEPGKWAQLAFEGRYGCVREARSGETL